MAVFEGVNNKWNFHLDFGKAIGLKKEGIVNLLSGETEDLNKVQFNLETRGQVYEFLCRDQIEEKGITPEEFAAEFGKGKLKQAQEILIEEIADFFLEAGMPEIAEYARKLTTEFVEARAALGRKVKGVDLTKVLSEKIEKIDLEQEIRDQTGNS